MVTLQEFTQDILPQALHSALCHVERETSCLVPLTRLGVEQVIGVMRQHYLSEECLRKFRVSWREPDRYDLAERGIPLRVEELPRPKVRFRLVHAATIRDGCVQPGFSAYSICPIGWWCLLSKWRQGTGMRRWPVCGRDAQ